VGAVTGAEAGEEAVLPVGLLPVMASPCRGREREREESGVIPQGAYRDLPSETAYVRTIEMELEHDSTGRRHT
jgi:hypothetical protein